MASNNHIFTEPDIEASVKAQAKLRAKLGFPVILLMSLSIWYWGSPYESIGLIEVVIAALAYTIYNFTLLFLAKRIRPITTEHLIVGTAIMDPLMLSAWLGMMGVAGGLFVCFYLFTILGFGFRIGPRPMWICQIASIFGFGVVISTSPVWQQHLIVGFSFLTVLIVVPIYARGLIKKLRDARAHAERESQAKSQLLAKVSHELRTPLSGIVASAQLIEAEAKDDLLVRRADTILKLSKELMLEINDLLDSAKYKANSLVLESALFDLTEVMDQIQITLASTAESKGIGFKVAMDDDVRDMVLGDSHYLYRVLMNIAGNAVKFTEKGSVDVYLKMLEDTGEQYRLRFGVLDTGIGIPKELHSHIFDPFFQASEGTTRKYGGTGLGMSIAKEIVTLMGGELMLDSTVGKGSHFYFDLMLPKVIQAPTQKADTASALVVYGKRILVADDNATNLILIKELLERDQHQVTIASTGQEALDILCIVNVDLIFMDYNMGDIDGAKVLQIYRFGKLNAAPAFFLTADTTVGTADRLQDSGAIGVLHKPITSDGLRQAIAQVFESEAIAVTSAASPIPLKTVPPKYIDYSVIDELQTLCPRPEFLTEVLENAALDIERNCSGLAIALENEDVIQVHDSAHALKGVSDSVGAVRLSAMAKKLMKITQWEIKPGKERWKTDIGEAKTQSVCGINDILSGRIAKYSRN
jgi:two-component system sensor histidine kinase RpfC